MKRELKAAGYKGEKVVFIGVTDLPNLKAEGDVGSDMLMKCGHQRRLPDDGLGHGGGSGAPRRSRPSKAAGTSSSPVGAGSTSQPGRSFVAARQRARWLVRLAHVAQARGAPPAWIEAPDAATQKKLAAEIQKQVFIDVPYIPLGQYFCTVAFKKYDHRHAHGFPIFWNVKKEV